MSASVTTPDVSVILTTHDRRALLEEAVASVRAQEGVVVDLVVVDDASADDTQAFLRTIDATVLRHDESRGPAGAVNAGLEVARAPLVCLLHDDDRLTASALERMTGALRDPSLVAAVGARRRFGDGVATWRAPHPTRPLRRRVLDDVLLGWSPVSGQAVYRTAILRGLGGMDPTFEPAEDRTLWLNVAAAGPVAVVPEVVLEYRVHPGQSQWWGGSRPGPERAVPAHEAFLRTRPPAERERGLRLRRARATRLSADRAAEAGRHRAALGLYLRSVSTAPEQLRSPFVWPELARALSRTALATAGVPARGGGNYLP
jgi:glycosyltransferase involved in cell wall biosynthesis